MAAIHALVAPANSQTSICGAAFDRIAAARNPARGRVAGPSPARPFALFTAVLRPSARDVQKFEAPTRQSAPRDSAGRPSIPILNPCAPTEPTHAAEPACVVSVLVTCRVPRVDRALWRRVGRTRGTMRSNSTDNGAAVGGCRIGLCTLSVGRSPSVWAQGVRRASVVEPSCSLLLCVGYRCGLTRVCLVPPLPPARCVAQSGPQLRALCRVNEYAGKAWILSNCGIYCVLESSCKGCFSGRSPLAAAFANLSPTCRTQPSNSASGPPRSRAAHSMRPYSGRYMYNTVCIVLRGGWWRGVGEREFRTPACGRSNHEIHRPSKVSPGEITRVISG